MDEANKIVLRAGVLGSPLLMAGCSEKLARAYTWENVLIGVVLGACLPWVLYALYTALLGKRKK